MRSEYPYTLSRAVRRPIISLNGKNALISGFISGIGLAIAESLAAAGANIVLNGFGDLNEIERTAERLKSGNSAQALYDPADMTQPEQIATTKNHRHSSFKLINTQNQSILEFRFQTNE